MGRDRLHGVDRCCYCYWAGLSGVFVSYLYRYGTKVPSESLVGAQHWGLFSASVSLEDYIHNPALQIYPNWVKSSSWCARYIPHYLEGKSGR